jgi:hypothetical protein
MTFTVESMRDLVPSFYADSEMVNSAFHLLLMKEIIMENKEVQPSLFQMSAKATKLIEQEKENERLNKEIDLDIKRRTRDNLKWQRWPSKHWYIVMVLSALLSAGITKILERPKSQVSTTLSRQGIQALIDSSLNRKRVP